MTLTGCGFVVFLLFLPVIRGQHGWGVTYTSTQICALVGSTVEIHGSYTLPSAINPLTAAEHTVWFSRVGEGGPADLRTDYRYSGRVRYYSGKNKCTLSITDLRVSDSAVYVLVFRSDQSDESFAGSPGVTLSVTGLQVRVNMISHQSYTKAGLRCHGDCSPPDPASYIWYNSGHKLAAETASWTAVVVTADSFSCAFKGHEGFPSPSVCVGQRCNKVSYPDRSICAFKGSSVDISCTYSSNQYIESKFWFSPERSHKWRDPDEPEDLSKDSQYRGRVQVIGRSTLRIRDLTESDSAEYRFKFKSRWFGWGSSLPGTRLTVTDPDLQVRISTSSYSTWAMLTCHSSCRLPDPSYFVWYKNGQRYPETLYPLTGYFSSADSYSCAVRGREDFPSPPKCVREQTCNRVTYSDRSICAAKGSTVDISCTYSSDKDVTSKFWFSPERSHKWRDVEQPEDLSEDSQYRGRVQVLGLSTLRIRNLTESDSAEYRFKFKSGWFEWGSSLPGTRLTVTDPDLQVQVIWSSTGPKLICHSSCLTGRSSFVWHKNDTAIAGETSPSYGGHADPADSYSCSYQRYRSPPVYVPKLPSVSMSPPADVTEGSSVTLTCSSDAKPAATYTWYKEDQTRLSEDPLLVLSSIQTSDSGQYYCVAENQLGTTTSGHISVDVKYAPKLPSVSMSPPGDVMEGSSVNLTCSSDANPAANYTWYKDNQTLLHGPEGSYGFPSISSEDRGIYYCKSENQHGEINSSSLLVDVQYAPKLPSVSMSPPGDVMEGSSVNLTCSSDANPAANYTWYKEDQDSPIASGQTFTITDLRAEDSGIYYCEAQNTRGRRTNTFHLTVGAAAWKSAAAGTITAVLLLAIALLVVALLWRRRRRSNGGESLDDRPQERERVQLPAGPVSDMVSADECHYSNIRIFQKQEDALYWNVSPAQAHRRAQDKDDDDAVEYTAVKPTSRAPGHQEDGEDEFALYSTVKK